MAIHHINCRVNASAVDDLSTIIDSMAWLCGDEDLLMTDRTSSYHGPQISLITAKISKSKQKKAFIAKLKQANFVQLLDKIRDRIDSSNTIHLRLCLDSLVGKKIVFTDAGQKSVKCNIKVKVFPGQEIIENITNFVNSS